MTSPAPRRGRPDWMAIPNLVTLVRLLLLVPLCLLLHAGPDTLSVVLLLVWASTDWVDGMLARLLDQSSRVGAIIDPIADRLGLAGIVLTLAVMGLIPWAALVIIVAVDLAMVLLATQAALGGRISVSWLGKIRTFVLMASVFLLVAIAAWAPQLIPAAQALLWAGVLLHTVCGVDYILRARRIPADAPEAAEPPSPR